MSVVITHYYTRILIGGSDAAAEPASKAPIRRRHVSPDRGLVQVRRNGGATAPKAPTRSGYVSVGRRLEDTHRIFGRDR